MIANSEISDTRIGSVMDVELGHGLLLARSPSGQALFSGSGLATIVNNTIRGSAIPALFDGACDVRAHLLFREGSVTDNGANDGLNRFGASFDNCIEMLENTANIYALSQSTTALIPRPAESELSIATCAMAR